MTTLQESVVGASLGADSIRNGIVASVVALVSVVAFVLFYYRASGINAMIAMLLNLIILFGAMAYLGATLTLPGIAGVILTIGMGIDSNVLIFERIREELKAGKTAHLRGRHELLSRVRHVGRYPSRSTYLGDFSVPLWNWTPSRDSRSRS